MDIEAVHIGMKLRNPLAGRVGEVTKIEREGGLKLEHNGLTWNEHVENVEEVCDLPMGLPGEYLCGGLLRIAYPEDFRPLRETAKCYIQVEPETLFLSQDAKRVVEFLTAADTPVAFWRIAEGMKDMVSGAAIIDGLIEAREAGIVRLDEGKYSLVRD
jgi:hypothetical protein